MATAYIRYIRINKLVNGVMVESFAPIPDPITAEELVALIPGLSLVRAQELIDSRVFEDLNNLCCAETIPINPDIQITTFTNTTITATWSGISPFYLVELLDEDNNIIFSTTTSLLTYTFTSLSPNTNYQIRVSINNCAGEITQTVPANTDNWYIQVLKSGCGTITLGSGFIVYPTIEPYSLVVDMFGNVNTMCKVSSVTINGVDSMGMLSIMSSVGSTIFSASLSGSYTSSTIIEITFTSLTADWTTDFICEQI